MKVYLVRHAIAESSDSQQWPDDGQRPLTSRGERRFTKAARGIERIVDDVDVVLSSPHVRAWETAMILHKQAGWSLPIARLELTHGTPEVVADLLREYAFAGSVAIVGHEPYLSQCIADLVFHHASPGIEMKKGAVACLMFESVDPMNAELAWLLAPRVLLMLA